MWFFDWLASFLARPYLHVGYDQGKGPMVVLLHGIGQSHAGWQPLLPLLESMPCRIVALDLLGFGQSPKPDVQYSVDDHATAVLKTIRSLRPHGPVIIVGHSMGALIATRLAYQYPSIVRHLILYEMPLYEGLPNTRSYRWRVEAYRALYKRIVETPITNRRKIGTRLIESITGQSVSAETWRPYVNSLKNTVVRQQTATELKQLTMPIDVIFGSRDMLVIRGAVAHIFGEDNESVKEHTIKSRHKISQTAAHFIAERLETALMAKEDREGHSKPSDLW